MTIEDVFLRDGELRSLWRFFLSIILIFLISSLAYGLARQIARPMPGAAAWYRFLFLSAFLELVALLCSFKFLTLLFDHKPLGVVGLAFHPSWVKELCGGLILGGIMMGAVGGAEALLGLAQFTRNPLPARVELAEGSFLLVFLMMSAANEELVFRGYPFQRLVDSLGPAGAIAVSSIFFGLVHLGNAHHTWISTANTMLVGFAFSIAYLRTRSLWMPLGMHFMWNYTQGFILGLPVSGFGFSSSLINAQVRGAAWLTGSGYGPEGGLLCTAVVAGAAVYLFVSARVTMSEKMRMLVFGPAASATGAAPVSLGLDREGDGPAG